MECKFSSDLLQQYVDEALDPLERIVTQAHLKSCEHCQSLVADLGRIARSLGSAGSPDSHMETELALMARRTALSLCGQSRRIGAKEIILHQRSIATCATQFLKHLPGANKAAELGKMGLQHAPKALWSVSCGLVTGGVRLAKMWA